MARTPRPCSPRLLQLSILVAALLSSSLALSAPMNPLGAFDHHQDVGKPKVAGEAVYNPSDQTYTLSSPSSNVGNALERLHLAWKKIKGDFIIQATVRFAGTGAQPRRQLGIMVRDALAGSSRYAAASVHGDTLSALQYRAADGAAAAQVEVSSFHPTNIQLARTGNRFTFSSAVFGEAYKSVSQDIALADEAYVGPFVGSDEVGVVAQAVFSNVRVIIPPDPGFKMYSEKSCTASPVRSSPPTGRATASSSTIAPRASCTRMTSRPARLSSSRPARIVRTTTTTFYRLTARCSH
jgi:TolB protein